MGEEIKSSSISSSSSTSSAIVQALNETNDKIFVFAESLQKHLHHSEYNASRDDLDFLHVRSFPDNIFSSHCYCYNSLYFIQMNNNNDDNNDDNNINVNDNNNNKISSRTGNETNINNNDKKSSESSERGENVCVPPSANSCTSAST